MKRIFIILIFLAQALVANATRISTAGGSVAGGGADTPHEDAAAWYTDGNLSRTVHSCLQIDPAFPVGAAKIQMLAQNAFQKWSAYYIRTGAQARTADPTSWEGCSIDGGTSDRKGFRIATQLAFLSACDGTEDLTLYFGVTNPDLTARAAHYISPFAFSETLEPFTADHHQSAWSRGLIWFAPNLHWENYEAAPLEMTLLHEIGHVFGNGHIDDTIMSETIGDQIGAMTKGSLPNTTRAQVDPLSLSIDNSVYLVFPPEQAFELPLVPAAKGFNQEGQYQRMVIQNTFAALTGSKLEGDSFSVDFNKAAGVSRGDGMQNVWELGLFTSTLTVLADGVTSKLIFTPKSFASPQVEDGIAFNQGCLKQAHVSGSIAGLLSRPDGTSKQVILSINAEGRVQVFDDPYNPSSFCDVYSRLGVPCILLTADQDQIENSLR